MSPLRSDIVRAVQQLLMWWMGCGGWLDGRRWGTATDPQLHSNPIALFTKGWTLQPSGKPAHKGSSSKTRCYRPPWATHDELTTFHKNLTEVGGLPSQTCNWKMENHRLWLISALKNPWLFYDSPILAEILNSSEKAGADAAPLQDIQKLCSKALVGDFSFEYRLPIPAKPILCLVFTYTVTFKIPPRRWGGIWLSSIALFLYQSCCFFYQERDNLTYASGWWF